jgi:gliding motility-associated-like protein
LISNLAVGNYSATITDANGCPQTVTVAVTTNGGASANAGPDVTIVAGNSTTLTANGGGTYSWSSGETDESIIVTPSVTTTYTVIVTDVTGCTAIDSVTVFVPQDDCGGSAATSDFFLPNAFSPNNDGENDLICLQGWTACIKEFTIHIYDRWGELVYESEDKLFCWDGSFNGKPMNTAVYAYYIKATLKTGGDIIRKGNITLLK